MSELRNGRAQQHMWTAMRQLGAFGVVELCASASTDDYVIRRGTATAFIGLLVKAGALIVVRKPNGAGRPGVWRLRPFHNTGPKAPVRLPSPIVTRSPSESARNASSRIIRISSPLAATT